MIPKKVHYCWFGRGPKPESVIKCINSWKTYLKGYAFVEWNEDNFDINCNLYVKQAYESKKYSFVTDYVRLYALYTEGGVYFDTDVEVLKSLDRFLNLDGFTGFEHEDWAITATIGSVSYNNIIKRLLSYYDNRNFIVNGIYDITTNTNSITKIFKNEYGIELNGKEQKLKGTNFVIFPKDYFCANNPLTHEVAITDNSYTVHYFNASWH